MELGKWFEAESLLREAADKSPNDPDVRRHLAETLWQRGAHEEAIEHMLAAERLCGCDAATAVRAGEMLLSVGKAKQAAELADKGVQLDHSLAAAWALRGRAYAAAGEHERALADYGQALRLAPSDTGVLLAAADLYSLRGQHERCLATLHRLIDSIPPGSEPTEALLLEGRTYLAMGRAGQAASSLKLAADRGPGSAELSYLQAQCEWQLGRLGTAETLARQAVAQDSGHAPAQQMLLQLSQLPAEGTLPLR